MQNALLLICHRNRLSVVAYKCSASERNKANYLLLFYNEQVVINIYHEFIIFHELLFAILTL